MSESGQSPPTGGNLIFPMRFGDRVMWSIRFAFASFWYTLGLYAILVLLMGVVFALSFLGLFGMSSLSVDTLNQLEAPAEWVETAGAGSVMIMLGSSMLLLLLSAWYSTLMYRLPVLFLEQGHRPPMRQLLKEGWIRTPDMSNTVGAMLLLPLILGGVVYGFLYAAGRLTPITGSAAGVLLGLVSVVLFLGMLLAGPVAANEPVSFWVALRRSWTLSRGRRWSLLGFLLVMPVLMVAVLMGIRVLGWLFEWVLPVLATPMEIVYGLSAAVLQIVYAVALLTGITVYYLESRIFLEGWVPNWRAALKPEWPRNGPAMPAIDQRSKAGWRDFILLNGVMFLGLWGLFAAYGSKLAPGITRIRIDRTPITLETDAEPFNWPRPGDPRPASPVDSTAVIHLKVGSFFEMGSEATVWIEPRLTWGNVALPSTLPLKGMLSIEVKSVKSRASTEWYDAKAGTESRFFWDTSLDHRDNGYAGIRQVQLRHGAKEDQIARIDGIVHWREPGMIQPITVTSGDVGHSIALGSNSIVLNTFDDRHIALEGPDGFQRDVIGVMATTAAGEPIVSRSTSASNGYVTYGFPKAIQKVTLYVGRAYTTHHWPFTLRPGQPVVVRSGEPAQSTSEPEPTSSVTRPVEPRPQTTASVHEPVAEPVPSTRAPDFDLSGTDGRQALRHWLYREVSEGNCTETLPWMDRLIQRVGDDAWAHYARGACLSAMGQVRGAEDDIVFACGHGYPKACDLLH